VEKVYRDRNRLADALANEAVDETEIGRRGAPAGDGGMISVRADQMIAGPVFRTGGKSELHRAGWSLTATGGDPKESATENIPPLPIRER